jgi:acetoin utilization protein AcuC
VPRLAEAFAPQLLLTQLGADTHYGDPLANLGLTMTAYPRMARILHETADRFADGRWVATGGGGYQAETIVPRVWTIHFAEMCGATGLVPADWLDDVDPAEVSRSFRGGLERSVGSVLDACLPRLSALATK